MPDTMFSRRHVQMKRHGLSKSTQEEGYTNSIMMSEIRRQRRWNKMYNNYKKDTMSPGD